MPGRPVDRSPLDLMHFKHSKYWYRLLSPFPSHLSFLLTPLRINRKWSRMDSRDSDKRLDFMLAALAVRRCLERDFGACVHFSVFHVLAVLLMKAVNISIECECHLYSFKIIDLAFCLLFMQL